MNAYQLLGDSAAHSLYGEYDTEAEARAAASALIAAGEVDGLILQGLTERGDLNGEQWIEIAAITA